MLKGNNKMIILAYMKGNYFFDKWTKNKTASVLLVFFFIVAFVEIVAEFYEDKSLIWITKPLLMPLLIAYYIKRSCKNNILFIFALFIGWIANVLFIENTYQMIVYGSVFFLIYKILVIYIVLKKVRIPGNLRIFIGGIPFLFIYFSIIYFNFNEMGEDVYLFLIHGIFVVVLGGISLGNYMLSSSKSNLYLFLSSISFTISQFCFVLKFYTTENVLHTLAMIFFVVGQFYLVKFMFLLERNRHTKYEIIKDFKEIY